MNKEIELRGRIPEYVIEPTLISQGMFKLSSYAQKLMAMAMALISIEKGNYTVAFKTEDFIGTMGLDLRQQSNETKKYIQAAVRECLNSHIEIKMPDGRWKGYTWFLASELSNLKGGDDGYWEDIAMTFNPVLGDALKDLKRGYSNIDIPGLVKLQSKYAIRFFRLAFSYAGFAGKGGNPPGQWYFEMSVEDIRVQFMIDKKTYPRTGDFRTNIIDKPIAELNSAKVGLQIEPAYIRRGRYLAGVRFNCRWTAQKQIITSPIAQPDQTAESLQDDSALIAAFPEEFALYKAEFLGEKQGQPGIYANFPEMLEQAAEGDAIKRLKEKYPDFGSAKTPKKKVQRKKPTSKLDKVT